MPLRLIDRISVAGSGVNEDRATATHGYAWVIDGATDVIEEPLTRAASDADWIAGTLDAALRAFAAMPACPFADLPEHLTATVSDAFAADARRQPKGRDEHPSAAGLIIKYDAGVLSYMAVADCTMIVAEPADDDVRRVGVSGEDAGDRKLKDAVRAHQYDLAQPDTGADTAPSDPPELLDRMRPALQALRARMNRDDGYGAFSITPIPEIFIRTGFLALEPGAHVLLATDGFMRLVDVFARYDAAQIMDAAKTRGLPDLLEELRALERADLAGNTHPRVKASDDASALLLEITN